MRKETECAIQIDQRNIVSTILPWLSTSSKSGVNYIIACQEVEHPPA